MSRNGRVLLPMVDLIKEKEAVSAPQTVKVAVVQAAPVAFNREGTREKVHALAGEAARKSARLVLFPEAFVSAYPRGLDFGAVVGSRSEEGREDFRRYTPADRLRSHRRRFSSGSTS